MIVKAFFGGSFDPPHYGHLGIARAALASGRCSHVEWFPAAEPPHKLNASRAPFHHRMNMVRNLIAGENSMSVSDFENRLAISPSYTIDVLTALEEETNEKYKLLIGADSLLNLHTWHEAEKLVRSTDFIIYPRAGAEITKEQLLCHWDPQTVEKLFSSLISGTFFEISSTEMKKTMEKNQFRGNIMQKEGFPPEIADYICEHQLYQIEHTKGML